MFRWAEPGQSVAHRRPASRSLLVIMRQMLAYDGAAWPIRIEPGFCQRTSFRLTELRISFIASRWFQRMAGPLAAHVMMSQPAQFLMNHGISLSSPLISIFHSMSSSVTSCVEGLSHSENAPKHHRSRILSSFHDSGCEILENFEPFQAGFPLKGMKAKTNGCWRPETTEIRYQGSRGGNLGWRPQLKSLEGEERYEPIFQSY